MLNPATSAGSPKTAFRTDIQALRGIAVLFVVAYHAGLPGLSAGYLGVDVFFVISGFLITSLIQNSIKVGSFSFASFYYRRAKRLLPAAYVVIFLAVLAAPWFLSELAIEDMKAQVIGALTFTANFVLYSQTGYFEVGSDTKPLLHFWSLAIEEQYYLVMPLLLWLLPRKLWLPVVASIVMLFAALSPWFASKNPDFAFFFPHTRVWEIALGSFGALLPSHMIGGRWLSRARLVAVPILLFVPFFPFDFPHPGLNAILVCTATLVIILGHDRNRLETTLPLRSLASIGNFSYSLYLVHWPVVVFTRAAWLESAPAWALVVALVISVVLSWLLYRFVEEPFRLGFDQFPVRVVGTLVASSVAIAFAPFVLSASRGSETDFTKLRAANYGLDRSCAFGTRLQFNGVPDTCRTTNRPKVLIWGDSYAMAWAAALEDGFGNIGLEQATMSACEALLGMADYPKHASERYNRNTAMRCLDFNTNVMHYIENNSDLEVIVVASRYEVNKSANNSMLTKKADGYFDEEISMALIVSGLVRIVEEVRATGKRVVVLAPPPVNGMNIGECLERRVSGRFVFDAPEGCAPSSESVRSNRKLTLEMLSTVSKTADVAVLDTYDFLCNQDRCLSQLNGTPLYRDAGHLSVSGARILGEKAKLAERILHKAH